MHSRYCTSRISMWSECTEHYGHWNYTFGIQCPKVLAVDRTPQPYTCGFFSPFGCQISVMNFILGGRWGYSFGNSKCALKNPPSLGKSSGGHDFVSALFVCHYTHSHITTSGVCVELSQRQANLVRTLHTTTSTFFGLTISLLSHRLILQ